MVRILKVSMYTLLTPWYFLNHQLQHKWVMFCFKAYMLLKNGLQELLFFEPNFGALLYLEMWHPKISIIAPILDDLSAIFVFFETVC